MVNNILSKLDNEKSNVNVDSDIEKAKKFIEDYNNGNKEYRKKLKDL